MRDATFNATVSVTAVAFFVFRIQRARLDLETILAFYTFSLVCSKAGITTSAFNDLTAVYTFKEQSGLAPSYTCMCNYIKTKNSQIKNF